MTASDESAPTPAERFAAAARRASYPDVAAFAARQPFPLDRFQVDACEAFERGECVLVCAPTGAGKTVVGRFAAARALAAGHKCFYTTPIKALSNQKYSDFVAEFGADAVGLITGDTAVNSHAPLVVMTTEVLRNMLYAHSPDLEGLAAVVLDEVHYLANKFRGAVWEEVILQLPGEVQLVGLSATVSNAEEFGDWIRSVKGSTSVIVDEMRPVPLWHHMMVGSGLYDLYAQRDRSADLAVTPGSRDGSGQGSGHGDRRSEPRRRVAPALQRAIARWQPTPLPRTRRGRRPPRSGWRPTPRPVVVDRLDRAGLLPAIVFVFSRSGCDAAVAQCVRSGLQLTSEDEADRIDRIVRRHVAGLDPADLETLDYRQWSEAWRRGIAAHHAGLLPAFKEAVEELFIAGLVKVVFATETLALGVNMPARTVVVERLVKYDGEGHVPVTAGEYTQLTGRAGRRGIDIEGHAVVLWSPEVDPHAVAGLAGARTFPLTSSFRPTYNMVLNLVDALGRPAATELLRRSFAQFQLDRAAAARAGRPGRPMPDGAETSMSRTLHRIADLLTDRGYLRGDRATARGRVLGRVWFDADLLAAECLMSGGWARLSPPDLAGVISGLVFESRRGQRRPAAAMTGGPAAAALDLEDRWIDLGADEGEYEVPPTRAPDFGFAEAVVAWARGADLAAALQVAGRVGVDLSAGDFVRWCRQVVDAIEQLAHAAPAAVPAAGRAVAAIRRGVVAVGTEW